MFANFTEETATGTGATLALAGATTGNIQFSKSFADGDLVAYVVEDSGGTIKVAGVGTYVSATDDITRNDTWNWNGTVVDDNPSTNITLSGGTHTVRCASFSTSEINAFQSSVVGSNIYLPHNLTYAEEGKAGGEFSAGVDTITLTSIMFIHPVKITSIGIEILAASAGGNARVGIYGCNDDGSPSGLLADSGSLSTASTGIVTGTLSTPIILPAGRYYAADFADNTTVGAYGRRAASITNGWWGTAQGLGSAGGWETKQQYTSTFGALPSTLGTSSSTTTWATLGVIFK